MAIRSGSIDIHSIVSITSKIKSYGATDDYPAYSRKILKIVTWGGEIVEIELFTDDESKLIIKEE
jgi:hypothetical protein